MNEFTHESISESFLDDFLLEFKKSNISTIKSIIESDVKDLCSDKKLFEIINTPSEKNSRFCNDGQIIFLEHNKMLSKHLKSFLFYLYKKHPNSSIINSGFFYYPKNSHMGWHTNADDPYLRCYISYSESGDSFFKYYDQVLKKTVISYDVRGWNIRYFNIHKEPEKLFWHCVYSNTDRISVGFKILKNTIKNN